MRQDEKHYTPTPEQSRNKNVETAAPEPGGATAIRLLNDQLRRYGTGGKIFTTDGVLALGMPFVTLVLEEVACFEDFTADNDPYGEHDCAVMTVRGHSIIWKVDYYDQSLEYGSPNPADPAETVRVLTIMLAEEY